MAIKICGIYKITSPSGRIYIGQSRDIKHRWMSYKSTKAKEQRLLYRSFEKHGYDSHVFEIICECEISSLNKMEMHHISICDSMNPKVGMNLTEGGAKGTVSEETKKLQSVVKKE